MKWKIKEKKKKTYKRDPNFKRIPRPEIGDKKEETYYAYFPTKVGVNKVWLEKYIIVYEFQEYEYTYEVPMSGIAGEDGSAIYASTCRLGIAEYETCIEKKWCEIERKL